MPAAGGEARQVTDGGGFEALEILGRQSALLHQGLVHRPVRRARWPAGPKRRFSGPCPWPSRPSSSPRTASTTSALWASGSPVRRMYRFFDFSTAKSRVLTQFKADGGQGLTVSPDGRTMLYGFASGQQSDLMLVENFR